MRLRNSLLLLLLLTLGALAACTHATVFGHTVKDGSASAPASAAPGAAATQAPITRIALEFTPAARKQVDDDERFNPEALRDAIVAELRSRRLLDLQHADSGRAAVIQLQQFEVRATSNVVLFGRLSSAGALEGIARIREAGGETAEFQVRADVPLHISRNGAETNPLKNLYRGFAEQFVDALGGVAPRSAGPRR